MIKSVRIHHTSDGGTMDVGASDNSVIEVNGAKLALTTLVELAMNAGAVAEIGNNGGTVTFKAHRCPEPIAPPRPTRSRSSREASEE